MSNLLSDSTAGAAASVGSFVLHARDVAFTPWPASHDDESAAGEGDIADVLEQLRSEAYAQGWDEGRQQAEAELAEEREALSALAASLESLRPESGHALAQLLAETVQRLVREIVGTAGVDAELLRLRAQAAAALVGEEMQPARLRAHPDDLPLLKGSRLEIDTVGDLGLARGTILIETAKGWVEDGPAVRLDRLRAELDRMGVPA
jgi:flagellar assembly protein FliH